MSSKRMRYDRIALVERNADEEDESSEEEGSDAESGSEQADDDTRSRPSNQRAEQQPTKQGRIHVALNKPSELVCHVCGAKGHRAGFVGATYMDCPNKPCYLCKGVGHTTATCPHRAMPGAAAAAAAPAGGESTSQLLLQREQRGLHHRRPLCPPQCPPWQVEAAILKLHSRRVTSLEFPDNSDSHVISGDKKGGIAVWNFMQVHDRTLYTNIHRALVNTLRWSPWLSGGFNCMSAASDGTAKIFDIETGVSQTLMDLNPDGWHSGCKWNMFYGADANKELGIILAGDSDGKVHLLDPRASSSSSSSSSSSVVSSLQLHKGGSKVNSVAVNPVGGAHVVLTAGGDHKVKLFDMRKLSSIKPPPSGSSSSSPVAPATPAAVVADHQGAAAAAAEGGSSRGRGRGRGSGRGGKRKAAAAAAAAGDGADSDEDEAAAGRAAGSGRGRGRGRGSSSSSRAQATPAAAGSSSSAASKASSRSAMAAAMAAAAAAELAVMSHGRVVNHAVFSPSGKKILTTCQDNRLRIWENLLTAGGPPTREIVHSHDFNRYLTPFKAEWFQNDPSESLIVCGRYISEDFGGVALHPIDIFDAHSGSLLQQLTDLNLNTITPVNKPHPRLDIIISGSSRSLYKWVPQSEDEEEDSLRIRSAASQSLSAVAAGLLRAASSAAAARSSSNFMCVDADPNGSGATKRSRGGGAGAGTNSVTKSGSAGAKSVTKGKAGSRTATAAGRGKGKKRGRGAAAEDDEDDDGEGGGLNDADNSGDE